MSRRLRAWITAGVPVLCAAMFLLRGQLLRVAGWLPPCLFHLATGCYCPGCGNTRSVRALLHGELLLAWRQNAAMPFLSLLLILLYIETVSAWFRKDGRPLRLLPRSGWFWGVVLGMFFAYYALRNVVPAIAPV